jgi:two-component system NtrC family sensor kinase
MRTSSSRASEALFPRRSLRRQLILLVLGVALVPLVIGGVAAYLHYRHTLRLNLSQALAAAADTNLRATMTWLDERRSDAQALSEEPALRCAAGDCPAGWNSHEASSVASNFLAHIEAIYGVYHDLTLVSQGGGRLGGSGAPPGAMPRRMDVQDIALTEVYLDPGLGEPTFEVIAAVRDQSGKGLALLVNRVRLPALGALMEKGRLGETGESYLVNAQGLMLTESRFFPGSVMRTRVDTQGFRAAAAGSSGFSVYRDYRGRKVLGAYRPVPGTDWTLLSEIDVDEVFAPLRTLGLWFVGILIAGTAGVGAVGAAAAGRVAEALERSERELAIKQDQLNQSGRLATVGEMAAGIAHEVNNPLTTLKLLIESFDRQIGPGDAMSRDVEVARREIDRIHATMLRFLSLAAPAKPMEEPTEVNEILGRILVLVGHQMTRQGVELRTRLDPNLPRISLDPSQIGQAILNVLLNAVQAVPPGGIIEVSTRIDPTPGKPGQVLVIIADSGPGIPTPEVSRVLEPFYTTKAQGTGLGLPITRSILDRHGGELRIGSSTLGGAEVTLILPLHRELPS